mmetsp:Transcript_93633/g.265120  ORF Transcript_93633/g.265120 Transcript_93633/m.265120 type:complete len:215 (-) Transcript_93633:47-691(-)
MVLGEKLPHILPDGLEVLRAADLVLPLLAVHRGLPLQQSRCPLRRRLLLREPHEERQRGLGQQRQPGNDPDHVDVDHGDLAVHEGAHHPAEVRAQLVGAVDAPAVGGLRELLEKRPGARPGDGALHGVQPQRREEEPNAQLVLPAVRHEQVEHPAERVHEHHGGLDPQAVLDARADEHPGDDQRDSRADADVGHVEDIQLVRLVQEEGLHRHPG